VAGFAVSGILFVQVGLFGGAAGVSAGVLILDDEVEGGIGMGMEGLEVGVAIETVFLPSFAWLFSTTATVVEFVFGIGDPSFFLCFFFFLAPFDFPSLHSTWTKSRKD